MKTATAARKTAVVAPVKGVDALALAKFSAKGERENVAPGDYSVDTTVRIVGTVKVGEDYEQRIVGKLPLAKLVMKLASQVSSDRLAKMLSPESLEAISDKDAKDFSDRIQADWAKLSEATATDCKGKVTAKLVFSQA